MLTLLDLFKIRDLSLGSYKLHLATGPKDTVLRVFFEGRFQRFQEEQHQRNFECDCIVSLIGLENGLWLFAGVYRVLGIGPGTDIKYLYRTEPVPGLEDLIGRVVVRFERPSRQAYVWGHRYGEQLEIVEIKPRRMEVLPFPQYNKIVLPFPDLRLIVALQEPGWKAALSNVQGVYLIADRKEGKLYVGSAYGEGGIWQRWSCYAETGHGDNIRLIELLAKEGPAYAENFQFSILEISDLQATKEFLIDRECHWKEALLSRFGYNEN